MNVIEASMFKKMERQVELDITDLKNDILITNCRTNRHIHDVNIHTNESEKEFWNNKINVVDDPVYIEEEENLILNRR